MCSTSARDLRLPGLLHGADRARSDRRLGGAFADPSFPWPTESGYDSRRHPWVRLPDSVSRYAPELWDPVRPVYAAGRYAEAAAMGLALIEARPDQAYLFYNVACCERPRRPDGLTPRSCTCAARSHVGRLP